MSDNIVIKNKKASHEYEKPIVDLTMENSTSLTCILPNMIRADL